MPAGIGPARADAAADEAPRHRAEPLGVEIAQIDDVDGHGAEFSMNRRALLGAFTIPAADRATVRHIRNNEDADMPAETNLFLCLKDNFGVLLHDPASGATAAIDAPEAAPVEAALQGRPAGSSPTSW